MTLALGQFLQLAYGFLLGFFMGLFYDFYRFFLHWKKPSYLSLLFLDLLFWLVILVFTMALLLCYPKEMVRLYLLCFQLLGFLFYRRIVANRFYAFLCQNSRKRQKWIKEKEEKIKPKVQKMQKQMHKPFYQGAMLIYQGGSFLGARKKAIGKKWRGGIENFTKKMRKNPPPPPPDED